MSLPLVSVLVPCHNAERFLEETLRSVRAQTWVPIEIVLVDDGSTDASLRVAQEFKGLHIKILSQEKRGASAARNAAFAEARGDYIQYLDADDLLSPDKIAGQVTLLEQSPPRCVACCATTYFQDGSDPWQGISQDGWPLEDSDDPLDWLIELLGPDGHGSMVQPGSWLVPREVAEKTGPWDERLSLDDDGEYFSRVALASKGIRRSQVGRAYYRKHADSSDNLSSQKLDIHQRSALLALDLRREKILALTSSSKAKRALARCYQGRAFAAYPFSPEISDLAMRRAKELGSDGPPPGFETWSSRAAAKLFGWKIARRAQVLRHRLRRRLMAW